VCPHSFLEYMWMFLFLGPGSGTDRPCEKFPLETSPFSYDNLNFSTLHLRHTLFIQICFRGFGDSPRTPFEDLKHHAPSGEGLKSSVLLIFERKTGLFESHKPVFLFILGKNRAGKAMFSPRSAPSRRIDGEEYDLRRPRRRRKLWRSSERNPPENRTNQCAGSGGPAKCRENARVSVAQAKGTRGWRRQQQKVKADQNQCH